MAEPPLRAAKPSRKNLEVLPWHGPWGWLGHPQGPKPINFFFFFFFIFSATGAPDRPRVTPLLLIYFFF
jgi:hypothetical protein